MSCRLIINVDDYGWSEGVNEAVCRLHDDGLVTSASLMVAGGALEDGLRRLESRPELGVGLHVAVVAAPSLLPHSKVPHITDSEGQLSSKHESTGFRYTFHPAARRELRAEVEAQFAAFAKLGIPWSHVDSHRHFHLTPVVFNLMLDHARRHRPAGFRVPEDDWELYRRMDADDARKQAGLARVFAFLCAGQRRIIEREGFVAPQRCFGLFRTGRLDAPYLERLIEELPEGLAELHCHPDLSTDAGRAEYEALSAPEVRRALEKRGVKLVGYLKARA